ncbi:MAG: transcriptional regulator [Flavobacteriales bacterium]|nr:transcriptional regulator [Flavobacteriales bacterium]
MIEGINKHFENRIRLGIMSLLMVNQRLDFNRMKESLQVTDGNLASHLNGLEREKYIEVRKSFIGKKPNTSYRATSEGVEAFKQHLNALESIINIKNQNERN